ncbi:MAG: oxygen-independent coproporphyrinogen III oxidase [Pseudomonadota bacterium]
MKELDTLAALGLFDARVPRYTSYPTAPVFDGAVGAGFQAGCLAALDPAEPVSVYVHIPYCERLCWFCACRTQGVRRPEPVVAYVAALEAELEAVARHRPPGVAMGRLHWGGGTPTVLTPALIARVAAAVRGVFPQDETFEFSVEIDPTAVDAARIAALAAEGMTRASIGVQDFAPDVQAAIGRPQSPGVTRDCVAALRKAGIGSLNIDLVYGLPGQSVASFDATLDAVLSLEPDRIALFGYAHVPHVARRQRLIDERLLPDNRARYELARLAADRLVMAGFDPVGIDHFARPGDALARAAAKGRLRRNFQGYTDDRCASLVGLGASSISRFPNGYVQNAPATRTYVERVEAGQLAGVRGHRFEAEDWLRARAIEMLMCDFAIDLAALERAFGPVAASALETDHAIALAQFAPFYRRRDRRLVIARHGPQLARLIARVYDAHRAEGTVFSRAS